MQRGAVKRKRARADACLVAPRATGNLHADEVLAAAETAAGAAARELPEALIIVFDEQLRFVHTAGNVLERLGDAQRYAPGSPMRSAVAADLWPALEPLLSSALAGETRSREIWTSEGRHCLMVDVGPLPDSAQALEPGARPRAGESHGGARDRPARGIAVVLDTTVRRRSESLTQQPEDGFEEVFENAPVGTGLLDMDGRWLLVNRALCDMTGYTAEELTGNRFETIVHPEDSGSDAVLRSRLLAGEMPAVQAEKRYFDASGEPARAILSMSLVRDRDGVPMHFIAQLQDVSDRRRLELQLGRLADRDPLTGLRSRNLFDCDLRLQVARCQRYGEAAGLLVIALEGVESIERRHGQAAGEEVLRAVARALTRRLRQTDLLSRLQGSEFAVILPHVDDDGLSVVADGVARVIEGCSVDIGEAVVRVRSSMGSAILDARTASAENALSRAERALSATALERPAQPR